MHIYTSRTGSPYGGRICHTAPPRAQRLNHSLQQGLKRALYLASFQRATFLGAWLWLVCVRNAPAR